jgi:hypothetical protein
MFIMKVFDYSIPIIPFQGRPGERGPKGQPGDQGGPVSLTITLTKLTIT